MTRSSRNFHEISLNNRENVVVDENNDRYELAAQRRLAFPGQGLILLRCIYKL